MLLSTIWMFYADYARPFKSVQRTFRDVEAGLAERELVSQFPKSLDPISAKHSAWRRARKELEDAKAAVADDDRRLKAQREKQDEVYRGIKAEFDSKSSYYNAEAHEWAEARDGSARKKDLEKVVETRKKELDKLQDQLDKGRAALDSTDAEIKEKVHDKIEPGEKKVAATEDDLKKLTGPFDRWAKQAVQKNWGPGDTFRNLPIIDGFAAPAKINQIWLPELTIDYSFKDVPRYDRCTTCHLGIDRGAYDKGSLTRLSDTKEAEDLNGRLKLAQEVLQERASKGENLGFDPNYLPGELAPGGRALGTATLILFLSALVGAGAVGALTQSWRVGIQVLAVGLAITLLTGGALAVFAPTVPKVKVIEDLTLGQVNQFAVHPRLDLFVDANSPHSAQKFGCTICHDGQGSATDFVLAAHTPADPFQKEKWTSEYGWEHSEFWDYPMRSSRFVESGCVKCHHDLTGLIRQGTKVEAPKLLKGYNLVKENGCFGCHEISGLKRGLPVGPDLRLEPTPPLEYLSAAEQDRLKSDKANPPGGMRKVGPSLRRLAEKTNQEWARKWVYAPREFRPDTRMPHFFNLANNNEKALEGTGQEKFPAAEVHGIVAYLFAESKAGLEGADTYRKALLEGKENLKELQGELEKKGLGEKPLKELFDVSRRFSDLALLSAPFKAALINAEATRQRQLQERLAELQKKTTRADADNEEIKTVAKELNELTTRLIELARPLPLAKEVVNEDGQSVTLPEKPGDAAAGRKLFTERGCLACHAHEGTTKEGAPAVASHANHGPELSRIAAKLKPEATGDDARRWLIQWLLNPNVYHPRTRMPITYLTVEQANNVAAWLLSQTVPEGEWKGKDPSKPAKADLVAVARVYLAKAPGGITEKELDQILPKDGELKGISAEKLKGMARDADERALTAPLTEDKLLWYIGRKAIARQGCYACHDIPGYETAKPIGTALNDWGKKDPDRIAFEDAAIWAKDHYHTVPERITKKELEERKAQLKGKGGQAEVAELNRLEKLEKDGQFWETKDGKEPYEEFFFHALEHHTREGFLAQKLSEPRSYDFNRLKVWDDRLRMPQFKFARTRPNPGEKPEDFEARQEKEEAEAREAVMTFILGLVAEQVPLKYLATPNQDRQAEIRGREVLDKFNCAGCHQIWPGIYEFKQTPDAMKMALDSFNTASGGPGNPNFRNDLPFLGHNAWFGTLSTSDRASLVGYQNPAVKKDPLEEDEDKKADVVAVRLTEAFRFAGPDGVIRDTPSGVTLWVPKSRVVQTHAPFGGTFVELLRSGSATDPRLDGEAKGYLAGAYPTRFDGKPDDARGALPPPLLREGERVQPDWLNQFLLNPKPIRPEGYVLLRMPRFNMSGEEARALANYFAAVSRLTNPGAGITAPFVAISQKDPEYWRQKSAEYVKRLKDKGQLDARAKAVEPILQKAAKKELEDAEALVTTLKKSVEDGKGKDGQADREKALKEAEDHVKTLKDRKDTSAQRKRWEEQEVYAQDAYRLLTNKELCVKCHNIGDVRSEAPQGPNLGMVSQRLRPDWAEWWIAHPARMFPYSPVMPQNFPNEANYAKFQELFVGSPLDQTRAARDFLMDLPRLKDLPAVRESGPGGAGGK
jgi:mono/diheme cytochrome c family protein